MPPEPTYRGSGTTAIASSLPSPDATCIAPRPSATDINRDTNARLGARRRLVCSGIWRREGASAARRVVVTAQGANAYSCHESGMPLRRCVPWSCNSIPEPTEILDRPRRDHTAQVIMRGHALMQKHPPRALRTRHRRAPAPAHRARVQRARPNDLTPKQDNSSVPSLAVRTNATVPIQPQCAAP